MYALPSTFHIRSAKKALRREKTVFMTDKDHKQFVAVSSTTLDRKQENFSGRIVLFCSEEPPGLRVLMNANDVAQLLLILEYATSFGCFA